jgi:hypothetical protein
MYFFKFIYIILYTAFYIFVNQKREKKWATNYLHSLENKFEGKFDDRTFNKIIFYYSLKIPAICDAFLQLHATKSNGEDKERLLLYFICSSVFDNFFDRAELTDAQIFDITFNSNNYNPKNFNEKISLFAHQTLLNFVADKQTYLTILKKEFDVQVLSRTQFTADITNTTLHQITTTKGGNAVLLCSFYLHKNATKIEQDCWYGLGCIVQYINDLFDIYRDQISGLQTIANRLVDAKKFKQEYLKMVEDLKVNIATIKSGKFKKLYLKISLMGIAALGIIAINQLIRLQNKNNNTLNLPSNTRQELIVDMEKPINLLRWIKVVYQLSSN